jgi:hypothetical protein
MKVVRRKWHGGGGVKSMSVTNHQLFHYYSSMICVYQDILSTIITALRTQIMYGLLIITWSQHQSYVCVSEHMWFTFHISLPSKHLATLPFVATDLFPYVFIFCLVKMETCSLDVISHFVKENLCLSFCSCICFPRNEGEGLQPCSTDAHKPCKSN